VVQLQLDANVPAGGNDVTTQRSIDVERWLAELAMALDGGFGLRAASRDIIILFHVVREQRPGRILAPPVHELDRAVRSFAQRRRGLQGTRGRQRVQIGEHVDRLRARRRHVAVGHVRQRDDADVALRQPPHVRAVPRQAAAVRDDGPEPGVEPRRQTDAVAERDVPGDAVGPRADTVDRVHPSRLLHLTARPSWERSVVGIVAWRIRVAEERDPACEVRNGRPQATHRRDRAVAERFRSADPSIVLPVMRLRHVEAPRSRPGGVVHAERLEEPFGHELLRRDAGDASDHASDDPPAEVRVLEVRARRPRERGTGGDQLVHRLVGQIEVAIGPRVVGGQP
jgi:hypothetical protein